MPHPRTDTPFDQALLQALAARGMSQRTLARRAAVNQSHLSRLLRQADYQRRPSMELMRRVALALDLPEDYFVEYREDAIIERVRSDADFREKTYARVRRATK